MEEGMSTHWTDRVSLVTSQVLCVILWVVLKLKNHPGGKKKQQKKPLEHELSQSYLLQIKYNRSVCMCFAIMLLK